VPYSQQPLQPLVRRDPAPGEAAQQLPVNIANGSINVDFGAMAGVPGAGQPDQANGWGGVGQLWRAATATVSPGPGGPGATNGQAGAGVAGYAQPLHLPDGKRLAYRMDYCVRESGNSYVAAVTSHTSYWANKDIAFFILTKMFPELEQIPMPNPVPN
jgi:hypothetical protein